ncbi:multiple antibiotic resistance protein [Rubritalea squalenifaciens DSM 18772]|uniref:UPF0056 membrane protein n=1 Tax=Rubritalea squalenifaciens DSM 18772 TaxID=1123071 RepID=A0A1M6L223_9BACT|nr:MarC family protein [Rubritalea squalenifaciens]SHJ65325.1 multiple antibiotic resistance protein [Rubritalea squalenifaciens DSM 18772]
MNDLLTYGLLAFTSFFTLINPIGAMPIFLGLTSELESKERIRTAKKSCIAAFIIICSFALAGNLLFAFFDISIDSFRVVGGVIFFIMGMDMLNARLASIKTEESEVASYVNDISITPLAIPMLCGPGALTNAIVLMNEADSLNKQLTLFGAIFIVSLCTYLILFSSSKIVKLLGRTGINVMMRLMGLIVMIIAVEFFVKGITPIIRNILTG